MRTAWHVIFQLFLGPPLKRWLLYHAAQLCSAAILLVHKLSGQGRPGFLKDGPELRVYAWGE